MMKERYKTSEFLQFSAKNKVEIETENDFVGDQSLKMDLKLPAGDEKVVKGCIADNMRLPFDSGFFDCYISNLSLMIVPDYKLQVKECFRVLKPGSRACFSVWGRPERSLNFTILKEAKRRLGRPENDLPPMFHISQNIESVKKEFVSAGFAPDLKCWYQPANWMFNDGEDFVKRFMSDPSHDAEIKKTIA